MADLRELYQQTILDHNRQPRNFKKLEHANHTAEGYNPLCGDQIRIFLLLEGDVIQDISFEGAGCAISKASASMMTASLKSRTTAQAKVLFEKFHEMVTGYREGTPDPIGLGKLEVFCGVSEFPIRVKCASLAWHTMKAALEGKAEPVSTE